MRGDTSSSPLRERYRIEANIGKGGQARTYRARDLETGQDVAVKILQLGGVDDWKSTELFEREAEALRSIEHPNIPAYLDHFQAETDEGYQYCLVQEYVEGTSLDEKLENGWHIGEEEARKLARELLEILQYLQSLEPPVIHRDIKPSNILQRPDDTYMLVDFGGVRVAIPDEKGGSTIIGSHGHMPHEQLMGRAELASDLYGLGATLVHLLSRKHPSALTRGTRLEFRDHIQVSETFEYFLQGLLEPVVEDRYEHAAEALAVLTEGDDASGRADHASHGLNEDNFETWRRHPDCQRLTVDYPEDADTGLVIRFAPLARGERMRRWFTEWLATLRDIPRYVSEKMGLVSRFITLITGLGLAGATFTLLLTWTHYVTIAFLGMVLVLITTGGMFGSYLVQSWREVPRGRCLEHMGEVELDISTDRYTWALDGEVVQWGEADELERSEVQPYQPTRPRSPGTVYIPSDSGEIRLPSGLSARDREWLISGIDAVLQKMFDDSTADEG